jgi:restriction system protein
MAFPKQRDLEVPLLQVIDELGGSARPQDIYPLVAVRCPGLTEEEQEQRLEHSPSARKWWNLVQWVRQSLVAAGEIDGATRGVWKLTAKGQARLSGEDNPPLNGKREQIVSLRDLANQSRDEVKARLLMELKQLTPTGFEHFCKELLEQLGFREMKVTKRSGDGGIDGFGTFRQGAVSINAAFQAKKFDENPVSRPDIDKLRGAIQGEFDHGVFITTSRFTKEAREASYKTGAITILLLDGESITEMMVERGIGVHKQPVYLYDVAAEFFDFESE